MTFVQSFVSAHPGWGFAYLVAILVFLTFVLGLLLAAHPRANDDDKPDP